MRGLWFKGVAVAALFGMAVAQANAQSADIGDSSTTEGRLTVGGTVSGALEAPGDKDWFQIQLRRGQGYRFTLEAAADDGSFDPLLRLLDANGAEIAINDDGPESLNSRLDVTAAADGVYYLEARGFTDDAAGAYTLAAAEYTQPTDAIPASAETTARLGLGTPLQGAVDFAGDADWYAVQLRPNQLYRFTLNAAESGGIPDPILRLLNSAGEEVASNDDNGENLNAQIETTVAAAGVYYLEARNLSESGEGGYVLQAERRALPPDAVGNNAATGGRIAAGRSVNGVLDYPRDVDWYRASLRAGQTYRVHLGSGEGDNALGDPLVRILNAAGEEVARDDDGGGQLNAALEFDAPATGTYFIEARGFGDDATGAYTLRLAAGDVPGDANTDAQLNPEGDYRASRVAPAGDSDWYALQLSEGQTVRLALNDGGAGGVGDPLLVVHDAQGAEVARDDDGGGQLNSYLEFTPPAAGRYFVEARAFDEGASGAYVLQLTPGEIGADTSGAESLDPAGTPRTSRIGEAGDKDWFALPMVEGRAYRIFVDGAPEGGLVDPQLTLIDGEGHEVTSDDDGGMGLGARIAFVAPVSGTYYASVSAFDQTSTGQYMVRAFDFEVPGGGGTDEILSGDSDARTSRIDMLGDRDFYQIELAAGGTYRFTVEGDGDDKLRDPFLTLISMDNSELETDDDSGPGSGARIEFTPEASGVYYLQVTSYEDRGTGDYTLTTQNLANPAD